MKPLPSLRQLRYLIAVIEHRHFSRAAEQCRVRQSTLSAGLQELEALLGAPLLDRSRRVATPTPLGRLVAQRAEILIKHAEDIVELARNADALAGSLHIGVIPTIAPFLAPDLMPTFAREFPLLSAHWREDVSARLLEQLRGGEIDVAIMALPYALEDFDWMALGEDPFWAVCATDHALAHKTLIEPEEIASSELLLLGDGHCLRDHAIRACQTPDSNAVAVVQGASLHTLAHMAARGLGVALIPNMAIESGLLQGVNVAAARLGGPSPLRTIGLVWRRGQGQGQRAYRQLGEAVQRVLLRQSG